MLGLSFDCFAREVGWEFKAENMRAVAEIWRFLILVAHTLTPAC